MGTGLRSYNNEFFIHKNDLEPAFKALKILFENFKNKNSGVIFWEDVKNVQHLQSLLNEVSWPTRYDDNGNCIGIEFEGEKYWDFYEEMFRTMAPFVKKHSYIECYIEHDEPFRWYFIDGKMIERHPTISWE